MSYILNLIAAALSVPIAEWLLIAVSLPSLALLAFAVRDARGAGLRRGDTLRYWFMGAAVAVGIIGASLLTLPFSVIAIGLWVGRRTIREQIDTHRHLVEAQRSMHARHRRSRRRR